jgi:hypothetical protein
MGVKDYLVPTSLRITMGHMAATLSVLVFFGILASRGQQQLAGQETQKVGGSTVDLAWAAMFVSLIPAYVFIVLFMDKLLKFMKVVESASLLSRQFALYLISMPVLCMGALVGKVVGLRPFALCEWWSILMWPAVYLVALVLTFDRLYVSDIAPHEQTRWRIGIGVVTILLELTLLMLSAKLDIWEDFEAVSWSVAVGLPLAFLDLLLLVSALKAALWPMRHLLMTLDRLRNVQTMAGGSRRGKEQQAPKTAADIMFSSRGTKYLQMVFYWPLMAGFLLFFQMQLLAAVDRASVLGASGSNAYMFIYLFVVIVLCCCLPWIMSDTIHMIDNTKPFEAPDEDFVV